MKTWEFKDLKLICDDFLNHPINRNTIDLIITSPPYNVDIKYNGYEDGIPYDMYMEFSKKWLKEAYRVLKDDGRMCLNIPLDKNKGGNRSVAADFTSLAQKVGFNYHSTIIWNESNISRRTAWGSYMSASAPYVIAPVEVIVILYKKVWKKQQRGVSDIARREFIDWTNGVWSFNGESKKRIGHPAPFPLELPKRCIKMFSYVGDTVLDPFIGSGTTLIECYKLNRKGIGIDIDSEYIDLAIKRIRKDCNLDTISIEEYDGQNNIVTQKIKKTARPTTSQGRQFVEAF